jgi:hypothetical protein
MTRGEAVRTGWLAHRAKGCELASPRPITYTLTGPKAPTRVTGLAQFQNGRLTSISATRGVHTAAGVVVGRTTSRHMISVYSAPPFSASSMFSSTFGGTFTTVKRNGKTVLQGFGAHKRVTLLAIPAVQVCD